MGGVQADEVEDAGVLAAEAMTLLRGVYLLNRELLGSLATAVASPATAHQVHRLRVLLATLTSWLESHESEWLFAEREADAQLHRAELAALAGGDELQREGHRAELMRASAGRVRDALRAADRLTFAARRVDLYGAAQLTGQGRDVLRAAVQDGELLAEDDGQGPLIALDVLARYAASHGLPWDDGLEDPRAGERHEARLRALIGA